MSTKTYVGRLTQQTFMDTIWVLVTDDGQYELRGDLDPKAIDRTIEVEATLAEGAMGINMVGPILNVRAWRLRR
ncbi:MAG: hypothetical protein ACE366_17255 [Bradymonadia bacterium]